MRWTRSDQRRAPIQRFLKSSVDPDPSWRGHVEGNKDPAERRDLKLRFGKRIPDQALLFADVSTLRVGAKHAADVANGSATAVPRRLSGWAEGLHWTGRASDRPGAAGTLQLPDGTMLPGRSEKNLKGMLDEKIKAIGKDLPEHYVHLRNPELRAAYAAVHLDRRGNNHGGCVEAFLLDDAIALVGIDGVRGAVSDVRVVRRDGHSVHGAALAACKSCQLVLRRVGVLDINSVRRSNETLSSSAINEYLNRLGFPGNWSRASDAIELLRGKGFPVSPAAQEMVRRFGGLDSQVNAPPPSPGKADVKHSPSRFQIDPFDVADDGEIVAEMQRDMGVSGLCPVGFSTEGSGIMCLDAAGTLWLQDCAHGYSGHGADEIIARLLEGRPNKSWWPGRRG